MERPRTLEIDIDRFEKVKEFLNSLDINSKQTRSVYHIALAHFQTFLSKTNEYDLETILPAIRNKTVDVYVLLNQFVSYLRTRENRKGKGLSPASFILYFAGVKSYIQFCDIELSDKQLKKRAPLPRKRYEDVEGVDSNDIIKMLLACNNDRLKVFILVLASSGMRANEALSLRNSDLNFSISPTRVHLRAENTKTKQGRDVYISDEATEKLKTFLQTKPNSNPDDLIFSIEKESEPISMYKTLHLHFIRVLEKTGLNKKRDDGRTRQVRFHSLRAFVKTTISNQGLDAFSEWFLGHRSSMSMKYYQVKEQQRREIYKKCMKYLTFLDLTTAQSIGADFESQIKEKDKEIQILAERGSTNEKAIDELKGMNSNVMNHLEKQRKFMALLLHNYFVLGKDKRSSDIKDFVQLNNKQIAKFIESGALDIDKEEFVSHLPDKYAREFGLSKKRNKEG